MLYWLLILIFTSSAWNVLMYDCEISDFYWLIWTQRCLGAGLQSFRRFQMHFSCVLWRVKHKSVIHTIKEQNHMKAFVIEILPVNVLYLDKKIFLWFFFSFPLGSKMVATKESLHFIIFLNNCVEQLILKHIKPRWGDSPSLGFDILSTSLKAF